MRRFVVMLGVAGLATASLVGTAAAAPNLRSGTQQAAVPGSAPAAAESAAQLAGAEKIFTLIPAAERGKCVQVDPVAEINAKMTDAVAGVSCGPGVAGVDAVTYVLLPNKSTLSLYYAQSVAVADSPSPDPSACGDNVEWHYGDQTDGGAKSCGDSSGNAQMVWTGDAQNLLGIAVSTTHDVAALQKWWVNGSAPLQSPDQVTFASTQRAARVAAAKRLIEQTGKATGCKQIDADASVYDQPGTLGYHWLPWIQAAIRCQAPQHQGPMEYFQVVPSAAAGFAAALEGQTVGNTKPTKQSAQCADGTSTDLVNPKTKKVDGQIECFYVGGVLWGLWYHTNAKGIAPGLVGAMPADNFKTTKQFYAYLDKFELE